MSTTIIAVIINVLVNLLPYIGIETDSVSLNTTIQTIVTIVTGIWIWYQRLTLKKVGTANSDVNVAGVRK